MTVSLSPILNGFQSFTSAGLPNAGGFLYTYAAGTSTLQTTYTASNGSTPNANPIVFDSAGRAPQEIWLTDGLAYKLVVADSTTAPIAGCTYDNVSSGGSNILATQLAASSGASLVGFLQGGTGSIARTAQAKLSDAVNIKDFGAVGDGVTDDGTALTNFWNSAIANPGVLHRLDAKTYATSIVLPTVNVSNVLIVGEGCMIHDVGTLMTGTVIKWIGTTGTAGPLVAISAVSGAGNQRVANVAISGFGINCNAGTINYGMRISSIWDSFIDVAISNANIVGLDIQVVATLGEAKDTQRNRIYYRGRQIETTGSYSLVLNGDSAANASMNEFWVDIQHKNQPAIACQNSDNNDWRYCRTYKTTGGTATESISLQGGASALLASRAERFWFLTCNLPVHVYGTAGATPYTVASTNHSIFSLDSDNGSPVPTVEVGGSIHIQRGSDQLAGDPWVAYTPTLSTNVGALTTASASGFYLQRGKITYFKVQISITTNGTGASSLNFTVPFAGAGAIGQNVCGKERSVTGKGVVGFLDAASSVFALQFYDGTYPGGNGYIINANGFYEAA